ncbi:MAG: helix-turn-helix transcriptional regulator [Candidatus Aminicenantes bacterium]|nr:helix-turn-helix transcriptional regulator [Candidatus Aminicenantes bacterium]
MRHFTFFYFFITFSIGIVSLGIVYSAYIKTKEKIIRGYLYFYAAFSLSVFSNLLLAYFRVNSGQINIHVFQAVDYVEAFIAKYLLLFTIVVFNHHLFSVPNKKNKNIFFGIIILCEFSIHHYFEYITSSEKIELVGDLIDRSLFFAILIYSLVLGILKYKQIEDDHFKSMAKKMLILLTAMLPGLINDIYLNDLWSFRFFPILYVGCSIIFSFHFVNRFLRYESIPIPEDSFFNKHQISKREKEIIHLILKGYSNQKISKSLFISLNTVKSHVRHIFEKFHVKSRFELMALFKNAAKPPH